MSLYKLLSVVLMYPTVELQKFCLDLAKQQETQSPDAVEYDAKLAELIKHLANEPIIEQQEDYVQTFDMNVKNSLYIFEHIHGDDKERGQALVNLKEEYEKHGFTIEDELPDYIPAFLEFLSTIDEQEAQTLVDDTSGVMALLEERLRKDNSVYAAVFAVLLDQASIEPQKIQADALDRNDKRSDISSCGCC